MKNPNPTAAIVGGGVIGLSCAICLAQRNIGIHLCAKRPESDPASYDARTYALSQTSIALLETAGVIPLITRYSNFETLEVWDEDGGHIRFDASDIGAARFGIIVEHKHLINALWQRLDQLDFIHHDDTSIASANLSKNGTIDAKLKDGGHLQLSLIIGADGTHSRIRQLMNVQWSAQNYHQTAFAYIVQTTKDHQFTGRQRFFDSNVLAFLPLAEKVCAVVWSCPNSSAHRIAHLNTKDLLIATRLGIENRYGELALMSTVASFELRGGSVDQYVAPGIMLMGDAAHNIHPMAGQGANLGFGDLDALLHLLDHRHSARIGYPLLRRYQRQVKGRNQCMKIGLEGLLWLFSRQSSLWAHLRNGALWIADHTPSLKNSFIHQAGGKIM